jgi:hypothetical protein
MIEAAQTAHPNEISADYRKEQWCRQRCTTELYGPATTLEK